MCAVIYFFFISVGREFCQINLPQTLMNLQYMYFSFHTMRLTFVLNFYFSEMLLDMSVTEVVDYEDIKAEVQMNPQTDTMSETCRSIAESDHIHISQNPYESTDSDDQPTSIMSNTPNSESSPKCHSWRKCSVTGDMKNSKMSATDNLDDRNQFRPNVVKAEKVRCHTAVENFDVSERQIGCSHRQKPRLKGQIMQIGRRTVGTCYGITRRKLEKRVLEWVEEKRRSGESMKSSELCGVAKSIAKELGIESFTASVAWLTRFRRKHNVIFEKKSVKQRQCIRNDFKLNAVQRAEEIGNRCAAREYKLMNLRFVVGANRESNCSSI